MALSDTSREAYHHLLSDFHHYAKWDYSTEYWNRYISAIFALAWIDFSVRFGGRFFLEDGSEYISEKTPELRMNDYILECLQAPEDSSEPSEEAINILVDISKVNPSIKAAIIAVYEWRKSDAGFAEVVARTGDGLVPIDRLYHRIV